MTDPTDFNDVQNSDVSQDGMRPETAEVLDNLSGIGTGAFLDMRQADTPEFRDWRNTNFTPDGSGSYVSREGQPYTNGELRQFHGVLSEQAGNPIISQLFNGPKSLLAGYMAWRNQNYYNDTGGGWEDEDGNLYSDPALQEIFSAKSDTQPAAQADGDDEKSQTPAESAASPSGSETPIVDLSGQMKTSARIPKPSPAPDVPPPRLPLSNAQQQQTLESLMAGINDPARTPYGLTPDGRQVLDTSPWVNMPSKIFPPKQKEFVYGDMVSPEFLTKVNQISKRLGIDPNWLMTAMHFETRGTFGAGEKNAAGSGATGLIQFMPPIAKGLGTTTDNLAKMKPEDQLEYVEKYLQKHSGQMHSLADVYMAILHPGDIGRPDNYVIFRSPTRAYNQNQGAFDPTCKGYITKGDVDAILNQHYQQALARGTTILRSDGSSETRRGNQIIVRPANPASRISKVSQEPDLPPPILPLNQ